MKKAAVRLVSIILATVMLAGFIGTIPINADECAFPRKPLTDEHWVYAMCKKRVKPYHDWVYARFRKNFTQTLDGFMIYPYNDRRF